ncbi:MAG: hypothetical protein R3C32_09845 [Chloroflexota bacterium]
MVTLNAALDVTYDVDELRPDASHRVRAVHQRAEAKGINVARVLGRRDATSPPSACWGGRRAPGGADLDAAGVPAAMTTIAAESRRTVSVVPAATGGSTLFNEPRPVVSEDEWRAFLAQAARSVRAAGMVVLSGNLPPGVQDAYAQLVRVARVWRAGDRRC